MIGPSLTVFWPLMTQNVNLVSLQIREENMDLIQTFLNETQGRSHANILLAPKIIEFAKHAETLLELAHIAKSYRSGCKFTVVPAGPYANSYKYKQTGTLLRIERRVSGWFMTAAVRVETWPGQLQKEFLTLSERQKFLVMRASLRIYDISVAEAVSGLQKINPAAFASAASEHHRRGQHAAV